ncbi:MAG: metallophosphoesterase [Patescibacteria group bacterium]|nr:metallophosphoesterase [Patescibacteria group bacterium]
MKLNLQINNQSFVIFDVAMIGLAVLAIVIAAWAWFANWKWLTAVMVIGILILAYGAFISPRRLKITKVKKALSKSPTAWLKAVYIADLHAYKNKPLAWYQKLFAEIREIGADMLLVGGDLVVADTGYLDKLVDLSKLDFAYGKYYILGNHDYLDDPSEVRRQMDDWGFVNLVNKSKDVKFQGLDFQLAGLDETLYGQPKIPPRDSTDKPYVLLGHEPDVLLDMKEGQADLVLCGHTHGGQIRLPLIGSLVVPSKLGRRADLGHRVINGIPTFVSAGLGEVLCRARLLCSPEIVVLELGI